ncbi:MAG: prepilin peptidase [Chloroflexi bacterium]|nr:MAG: prepilin peptidase [Chloroflexota bacterium]RLC95603.1 MAG: prepilin peptidase [Chloroflexota bacterium]
MLYTSLVMLAFALLGASVGSFLNLCIDRLPLDESILRPPSHCPTCGRRLSALDLVPVLSYLWLHGRCRYCGASIPLRTPMVEAMSGLIFALLYWKFGLSAELGMSLTYTCFLIVIFFIDLEHYLILNKVVYPGIVVAFVFSLFWPGIGLKDSLIGGAVAFAIILIPHLIYPPGMGLGDVRLALMVGLMNGYPQALVAVMLAILGGGLLAAAALALGLKKRGEGLPFGTFLAVGAMVSLLWGQGIYDWYMGWFRG